MYYKITDKDRMNIEEVIEQTIVRYIVNVLENSEEIIEFILGHQYLHDYFKGKDSNKISDKRLRISDNVGIIDIKCKIHNNEVIIVISDNGKGIENIEMAKQPLYTTKPNLERSGMGFTIMESFMDELNIESILGLGTKVTMKKKIGYDIDEKNNIDNLVTLEEALRGE